MKIKVIGSGSKGNAYLVSDGKTKILLDCGISVKDIRIACDFALYDVRGCFVTHCHQDHCKSLAHILNAGIDSYLPGEEMQLIPVKDRSMIVGHHRCHPLQHGDLSTEYKSVQVGTFDIIPFRVAHDTPEPVGYLLFSRYTREKLVYFTDTYTMPYKFVGLTHIIGECNYNSEELLEHIDDGSTNLGRAKRLFRSHMSLETFLTFLAHNDLSKLQQIYICHMSDDHGNEEFIKEAVQKKTGVEVIIC